MKMTSGSRSYHIFLEFNIFQALHAVLYSVYVDYSTKHFFVNEII